MLFRSAEERLDQSRCQQSPFREKPWARTDFTDYAADINLILAYYKCLDDWQDDKSPAALIKSRALASKALAAQDKYPRQTAAIKGGLSFLGKMEKHNELNPDLPANCFGAMMAEVFAPFEDRFAPSLKRMGAALGRFIYLMDAVLDLPLDIRRKNYNPLVSHGACSLEPALTMLIGECTREFEALPLERDRHILRNILYSGVWVRYNSKKKGGDAE